MKLIKRDIQNTDNRSNQNNSLQTLRNMHEMMDKIFSDNFMAPFSGSSMLSAGYDGFVPSVDASETDTHFKFRVNLPGVDPKDVSVEVTDDKLILSGKIEKSDEEENENYHRVERSYGEFHREFVLPARIDTDSVEADGKNGVITISLKKAEDKSKKRIEINSK